MTPKRSNKSRVERLNKRGICLACRDKPQASRGRCSACLDDFYDPIKWMKTPGEKKRFEEKLIREGTLNGRHKMPRRKTVKGETCQS